MANSKSFVSSHSTRPIYPTLLQKGEDQSLVSYLMKAARVSEEARSGQAVTAGIKEHPFNMDALVAFKDQNEHHSVCIDTKVQSTVGLGFANEATEKKLSEVCDGSVIDLLTAVSEDHFQTGTGYIEVVRDSSGKILGLHHLPSPCVRVVIENEQYDRHYLVEAESQEGTITQRYFADYGDRDNFIARAGNTGSQSTALAQTLAAAGTSVSPTPENTSELIQWRRPTSRSRWYGWPDWIAAVASIEIVQMLRQHTFDFFLNRGVPEFLLFVTGAQLDDAEWNTLKGAIQANIGLGNSFKSGAFNFHQPDLQVQVEKLGLEGQGADSQASVDLANALAMSIVAAHRTPPLLAGINIPSKIGATNEFPNALLSYQLLLIGPAQKTLTSLLDATLGDSELNGGLGLAPGAFKLKAITDEFDLQMMDTQSRMKDTVPEAKAKGRDLRDGLKKQEERAAELVKMISASNLDEAQKKEAVGLALEVVAGLVADRTAA